MRSMVSGALAGLAATMVMTAAMRRLHPLIENRYPLPPREIIDRLAGRQNERDARIMTILAHFGFGAAAGAIYATTPLRRLGGIAYGLGVWAASYLGWIPAARILPPATEHPMDRNLLMVAVHVVWGLAFAASLKELDLASDEIFGRHGPRSPDEVRAMEPGHDLF